MATLVRTLKLTGLPVLVVMISGACGPCCFEPGPVTGVSLTFTGIHEPTGPVVREAEMQLTTYAILLEGCEAEAGPPIATAWVNGAGPTALHIEKDALGVEGCYERSELVISGEVTLQPGRNEVRINVFVDVGLGEPNIDEDETIVYDYQP